MRVWDSRRYYCKSDISRDLLRKLHIPDSVTLECAKESFDDCVKKGLCTIFVTGDMKNKKKQRHTAFVSDYVLYKSIIRGL